MENYYYIDFKDLDIYSNEGETVYNAQDEANFVIGNKYPTFHEAQKALEEILSKNKDDDDISMLERENKAMADKFLQLGYTLEQISDICNGAI